MKPSRKSAVNNKTKSSSTIEYIGKYGSKILISTEAALKAKPEPLYKQAEYENNENNKNIAKYSMTNKP